MRVKINKQGWRASLSRLQKWRRENFLHITLREDWMKQSGFANVTWCFKYHSLALPRHTAHGTMTLLCCLCWVLFSPLLRAGKVISRARPGEPNVSFCILRTQINQPAPYPEMAILPRNLHICILLFFPEFNFLQELILITLFKQRGFGVYTNMTFFP